MLEIVIMQSFKSSKMLFVILKAACCTVDLHTCACTLTTECRVVALFIRSHQNCYDYLHQYLPGMEGHTVKNGLVLKGI